MDIFYVDIPLNNKKMLLVNIEMYLFKAGPQ